MIRIPQVRVIDEEGEQLGVMPTPRALDMAQERGYDLVEVAPMASPPVVRFLDFGQYKYELTKREKDNKRRQRSVSFKEVRLSPKIGQGDFETKLHRAIEFLEDGDRIKVTVRFRGRELTHPEIGRALLTRFTEQIKEHGVVERAPLLEGKQMHLTVASLHKPKAQDLVALQVHVAGRKNGKPQAVTFRLIDYYDCEHGISAMMRTTGYSLSITGQMQADGRVTRKGVHTPDEAVPFQAYVDELGRRGVRIEEL
jgi:translation initiation factor IF-3